MEGSAVSQSDLENAGVRTAKAVLVMKNLRYEIDTTLRRTSPWRDGFTRSGMMYRRMLGK